MDATSKTTVTTTITDDDSLTGITLSANPSSLGEDDSATTITVTATLNGGTRAEATVVTIGTLAGTATKDTDYTVTTTLASITIPANTASADRHDHHHPHGRLQSSRVTRPSSSPAPPP